MIKRARELLASPVYFLAFCFHLLCAGFTRVADWIAGEGRFKMLVTAVLILGWTAFIGFAATRSDPNQPDIYPSPRAAHFNVAHGFSAEVIEIALPAIRNNACITAQNAVRTALKPKRVGFEPCTAASTYVIAISEDLQDITVSGIADIEKVIKSFMVKLQHYPPAIWAGGFLVLDVQVG